MLLVFLSLSFNCEGPGVGSSEEQGFDLIAFEGPGFGFVTSTAGMFALTDGSNWNR